MLAVGTGVGTGVDMGVGVGVGDGVGVGVRVGVGVGVIDGSAVCGATVASSAAVFVSFCSFTAPMPIIAAIKQIIAPVNIGCFFLLKILHLTLFQNR